MKPLKFVSLLALVFILSSCYHTQIITDAKPSGQVIEEEWAASFVFGLVPPKEVRTASQCPNGVAKVETEISFLNGLVAAITFNIFTPMHIKVTCAAGSGMSSVKNYSGKELTVAKKSGDRKIIETIQEASEMAEKTREPVLVRFR
ncbi:MAG TPA: hypothetical protein VJ964_09790 [Balneolaceae bacterium]|nr:hypothetical protein [Balneolaceae bacterium]